jgi:hypothetical protein
MSAEDAAEVVRERNLSAHVHFRLLPYLGAVQAAHVLGHPLHGHLVVRWRDKNAGAAFFSSQDASQFSSEVHPQADHGRLQGVTERKRRGDGESRATPLIVNLAPNTRHVLRGPPCGADCCESLNALCVWTVTSPSSHAPCNCVRRTAAVSVARIVGSSRPHGR